MSLFSYKYTLDDGKVVSGQRTAKTAELVKEHFTAKYKIASWQSITEVRLPAAPKSTPTKSAVKPAPQPTKTKSATKLEKLLFLQSNKCFFCGRVLEKEQASVEHLMPQSGGGTSADGNVVACCVSLNRAFGNMPLKEKIRVILEKAGSFSCPKA